MGINAVFMKLPSTSGILGFCPCWFLPVNPQMLLAEDLPLWSNLYFWSVLSVFIILYLDYLH